MARQLAVMIGAALIVIAGAEALARRIVDPDLEKAAASRGSARVRVFPGDPRALVPDLGKGRPVLLMGNSHTYALPGRTPSETLRSEGDHTLVDELAARLPVDPGVHVDRLSYPNFLPFEMLTRVAQLRALGYRPGVVVLGLTWRNLARDATLRFDVHRVYQDAKLGGAVRARLAELHVAPDLLAAIDTELDRGAVEVERERNRSIADAYDNVVTVWLGERLTLLGRSGAVRAGLFRLTMQWIQIRLGAAEGTRLELVPADLRFNIACLEALLDLLAADGVRVVLYFAPERSDLPPMMDPGPQETYMAEIAGRVRAAGGAVVDARHVVPGEYWGWDRGTPDRSHFTEPGHERLAAFIVQETSPALWGAASP